MTPSPIRAAPSEHCTYTYTTVGLGPSVIWLWITPFISLGLLALLIADPMPHASRLAILAIALILIAGTAYLLWEHQLRKLRFEISADGLATLTPSGRRSLVPWTAFRSAHYNMLTEALVLRVAPPSKQITLQPSLLDDFPSFATAIEARTSLTLKTIAPLSRFLNQRAG